MIVLISGMRTLLGSSRFLIKSTSVMRPSVRYDVQDNMQRVMWNGEELGKGEKEIREKR